MTEEPTTLFTGKAWCATGIAIATYNSDCNCSSRAKGALIMSHRQHSLSVITCKHTEKYGYEVVVVVVLAVGQTVGSISRNKLAYDCLYTLELCTASMIATSADIWRIFCPVQAVLEIVHCSVLFTGRAFLVVVILIW